MSCQTKSDNATLVLFNLDLYQEPSFTKGSFSRLSSGSVRKRGSAPSLTLTLTSLKIYCWPLAMFFNASLLVLCYNIHILLCSFVFPIFMASSNFHILPNTSSTVDFGFNAHCKSCAMISSILCLAHCLSRHPIFCRHSYGWKC